MFDGKIEVGKQYIVTTDEEKIKNTFVGCVDIHFEMKGKIVTVSRVLERFGDKCSFRVFEDPGDYAWGNDFIEAEVNEKYVKKEDTFHEDIDLGDVVGLRDWDELTEFYYEQNNILIVIGKPLYKNDYNEMCKEKFVVKRMNDDTIDLITLDKPQKIFVVSKKVVKIIEKRKIDVVEEFDEDEIINEMIYKIDVKKIKKILASAYRIRQSDLLGVDVMLKKWANQKKRLYLALGRKIKITEEFDYEPNDDEFKAIVLESIRDFPYAYGVASGMDCGRFKKNSVEGFVYPSDFMNEKYGNQTKLSKVLIDIMNCNPMVETFNGMTDEEIAKYLELKRKVHFSTKFENVLTQALENRKVKGYITISIDPIDFMMMSVNKSGWNSCYKLFNSSGSSRSWGQYSAGIFSYIEDKSTLIAYKDSGKLYDYKLGSSKIQDISKSWRQVIYMNPDELTFITSRQYPRKNNSIADKVRELLEAKVAETKGIENKWKTKTMINDRTTEFAQKSIYQKSTKYSYNDILHYNNVQESKVVYHESCETKGLTIIETEEEPICPICGKKYMINSNVIMCEDCYHEYM